MTNFSTGIPLHHELSSTVWFTKDNRVCDTITLCLAVILRDLRNFKRKYLASREKRNNRGSSFFFSLLFLFHFIIQRITTRMNSRGRMAVRRYWPCSLRTWRPRSENPRPALRKLCRADSSATKRCDMWLRSGSENVQNVPDDRAWFPYNVCQSRKDSRSWSNARSRNARSIRNNEEHCDRDSHDICWIFLFQYKALLWNRNWIIFKNILKNILI